MFKKTGEGTPSLPRQSVSWICLCSLRCESRDLLAHAPSHMSLLTSLSVLVMHTSNYRAVISHLMRYLKEACQPFCFIPEHSFTVTQRERKPKCLPSAPRWKMWHSIVSILELQAGRPERSWGDRTAKPHHFQVLRLLERWLLGQRRPVMMWTLEIVLVQGQSLGTTTSWAWRE